MDIRELQGRLRARGYDIAADGAYGPKTRDAILAALTDPADLPLSPDNVTALAHVWEVDPAAIWAVRDVEASGKPFVDGRPTILFEPHRFSRATAHRFDATHPDISYPNWRPGNYPASQTARWMQVLKAVALDVDAAFASASYGAFQILGENFAACEEKDSFAFALSEAQGEPGQLRHFAKFVEAAGLVPKLRKLDWAGFARGYNGTSYASNKYDARLAAAFAKRRAA